MTRTILLGFAALALSVSPAHATQSPPMPEVGIDQRLNAQVPLDLKFRDEQGSPVVLSRYFSGKPVILVLGYYRCPRLCSLVLNGLADSLRRIRYEPDQEFIIVTVSIDAREGPELAAAKKASYVTYYGRPGAERGWHFLTGDDKAIQRLAAAVGFRFAYDSKSDLFAHGSGIMVLTPAGTIARYLYGVEFSPRDLRFALEDAAAGNIGSPIARPLRLLCFGYDPASGQYTLLTMRLVRIGAVITVLLLGGFIARQWRRERMR